MLRSYTQSQHFPADLFKDIDHPEIDELSLSTAAEFLSLVNTIDALPYLKRLLVHTSALVRESACIGCIDHMHQEIYDHLVDLSKNDQIKSVRETAQITLDTWKESKPEDFKKMSNTKFDITEHFKSMDVLDKGYVELIDGMVVEPGLKIVNSARVSFNKESQVFEERDKKLTKYLYDHGHFSTFRHSYFTFRVKAPLFVFRQWWKYQVGSQWQHDDLAPSIEIPETNWNEMSGRYVELSNDFYIPSVFRKQSKDNKQGSEGEISEFPDGTNIKSRFEAAVQASYDCYKELVNAGVAKEISRVMLPQNVYSECIWTCSLQTLIFFFKQRLKDDAQFEIREYAWGIYSLLRPFLGSLIEINESGYTYLQNKLSLQQG